MRFLYFLLKIVLNYSLSLYHKRYIAVNAPKQWFPRTVFASNHPSSFMDPLVIAARNNPIVHFMTRGDIYKGFMKYVFWNVHMIPIYRNHDGDEAVKKNQAIFNITFKELKKGRGIIVFAEGFTDDKFKRRLKPIKKGSARMAFGALNYCNWEKKIYLQAVGLNYTDPRKFRSEVLVSYGSKILLNDYKDEYLENPSKVINEVTRMLEIQMREQITHVENKDWCKLHEGIMSLTRKGMNEYNKDESIPLKQRWEYSRNLALWLNQTDKIEEIENLKEEVESYFNSLKKANIKENYIYEYVKKGKFSLIKNYLLMIVGFPFAILGFIHGAPAYFLLKPKVEKAFKRRVFWSGVKMVGGLLVSGLYNIIFIFLIYHFIYPSWLIAIAYYFLATGIIFVVFHKWYRNFSEIKTRKSLQKKNLSKFIEKRQLVVEKINIIVPVA